MKIPSIRNICDYFSLRQIKKNNESEIKKPEQNLTEISSCYPRSVFIQPCFIHRTVSSKIPNYEPLNCDYSNQEEFIENFSQKINSQLMTIDKKDVENLINRIYTRTNADTQLIKNVLYKLTFVSSTAITDVLSNACKEFKGDFFDLSDLTPEEKDYSLNTALSYLAQNKKMIKTPEEHDKYLFVLDDIFLKQLERAKKENTVLYEGMRHITKEKKLMFINIPGWDVKCSDNKYRSANFLLGNSMLEDLACDVVNRVKKGENADDIITGDLSNRLYNIFADKEIIKTCVFKDIDKKITVDDILENLRNTELPQKKIQQDIQWAKDKNLLPEESKEILFKYLDETSIVYSNDSMAQELIKLHKKISSEHGDAVYYHIPNSFKSYGYITSIFVKLNGIDTEKMQKQKSKKIFVIDDITASGESMITLAKHQNYPINFAYILASPSALNFDWTDKKPKNINDVIYAKKLKCAKQGYTDGFRLLTKEEIEKVSTIFKSVFGDLHLSCAFPHIIPDNVNIISANIFNGLLTAHSKEANKAIFQINNLVFKKDKNGENLAYFGDMPVSGMYTLFLKPDNSHSELYFTEGKLDFCRLFDSKGRLLYQKEYETFDDGTKAVRIYNFKNKEERMLHLNKNTWCNEVIVNRKKKTIKEVSRYEKDENGILTIKKVKDGNSLQVKKVNLKDNKTETSIKPYAPKVQKYDNKTLIIIGEN